MRIRILLMYVVIEERVFRVILMVVNFSGVGGGNIFENSVFLLFLLFKFDMISYVG